MAKPKLALYWAASCGGCDVAVLDTNEKILDIANLVDIVFWPIAIDFKYHHVEAMPDKSIDLCLFNGAIRNSEQENIAKMLRAKSKVLVAFGACAVLGGIPGLANFTNRAEIWQQVYVEAPSMDGNKTLPQTVTRVSEGELDLPEMYDTVSTLAQVVDVEYFLPGCPPPVDLILKLVDLYATGKLPPVGAVVASDKSLCDECDRIKEEKKIIKIHRPHEIIPDSKKCLLEQGVICCGPATRGGCGVRCIKANMPCRGCFGPPPGVIDQGAKMLSALASIYQGNSDADIKRLVDEVIDPAGTFYRFGLASSLLKRKRLPVQKEVKK
ncbi:MAG: coenzyme F420-reducing hydrogenase, gamma subunit [Dehalococcoidales bacterium]|nr:coenzyme F420-reducing hydrogenase, gamma subunit [Dehalococcoidales bacterium]